MQRNAVVFSCVWELRFFIDRSGISLLKVLLKTVNLKIEISYYNPSSNNGSAFFILTKKKKTAESA